MKLISVSKEKGRFYEEKYFYWPYANNTLHVGHLASLLPGDVLQDFLDKVGIM